MKGIAMNLNATYTWTPAGHGEPITVTPKIRDRPRETGRVVTITNLAPLLSNRIDAITDEGDRAHTLHVLAAAIIAVRDQADTGEPTGLYGNEHFRDHGRVATTYAGTRDLPVSVVLDLAEQIRTALDLS